MGLLYKIIKPEFLTVGQTLYGLNKQWYGSYNGDVTEIGGSSGTSYKKILSITDTLTAEKSTRSYNPLYAQKTYNDYSLSSTKYVMMGISMSLDISVTSGEAYTGSSSTSCSLGMYISPYNKTSYSISLINQTFFTISNGTHSITNSELTYPTESSTMLALGEDSSYYYRLGSTNYASNAQNSSYSVLDKPLVTFCVNYSGNSNIAFKGIFTYDYTINFYVLEL